MANQTNQTDRKDMNRPGMGNNNRGEAGKPGFVDKAKTGWQGKPTGETEEPEEGEEKGEMEEDTAISGPKGVQRGERPSRGPGEERGGFGSGTAKKEYPRKPDSAQHRGGSGSTQPPRSGSTQQTYKDE